MSVFIQQVLDFFSICLSVTVSDSWENRYNVTWL